MENDAKENTEAVEAVETEVEDGGSSADQNLQPITDDDGLVSTMEYEAVEEEPAEEETDSKEETPSETTETKTEDTASKKTGFHDHPDWKAMIAKKNQLESENKSLKKSRQVTQQPKFKNIMSMEDDAIMDEFTDNPKQFLTNFAQQLFHEIGERNTKEQQQNKQKQFQQSAKQTYADFFGAKEDGQQMLTDGRIEKFIQENPGHNAISAYHALAGESQLESKIEEAVKAERAKIKKELKAAGNAKSFSSQTSGSGAKPSSKPEFKNPDKYGGKAAVLVRRFKERQVG